MRPDKLARIPGIVFGCLQTGTIDIHVFYNSEHLDGRSLRRVNLCEIPYKLRTPNTYVWIHQANFEIVKIEAMDRDEVAKYSYK